jgi:hypothetical protein
MDAVNASEEALPWLLVTRLAIGGAGDAGGGWLDFLVAAAERWAV